jgi:hypothetical protein
LRLRVVIEERRDADSIPQFLVNRERGFRAAVDLVDRLAVCESAREANVEVSGGSVGGRREDVGDGTPDRFNRGNVRERLLRSVEAGDRHGLIDRDDTHGNTVDQSLAKLMEGVKAMHGFGKLFFALGAESAFRSVMKEEPHRNSNDEPR